MATVLLSYVEMCKREGRGLRRGMNFGLADDHSVILMSAQRHAPYQDRFQAEGAILIYEGHDAPRSAAVPQPKAVDQPLSTPFGTPTQNAKFHQAARAYQQGASPAERVRVYEKLRPGLWLYHGVFHLVDSWQEEDGTRKVFKFKLAVLAEEEDLSSLPAPRPSQRRTIPRAVKLAVWQRDGGRCVVCGAVAPIHFDHIVPYSQGGTSAAAENIQLLCARHNLAKGAKHL